MSTPRTLHVAALAALVAGGALLSGCSGTSTPRAGSPSQPASSSPHPSSSATTERRQPVALRARLAPWRLPSARSREVALSTPGGLVLAGGLSSAHVSTPTVWTLSTSGRLLHSGSLAVAVHDATGLVVNHQPFVIAGGNTTTIDDVQALAASGRSRVVAHLPQPRSDLSATSVEGSGYVLGGFDGTTSLPQILRTGDGTHFVPFAQLRITVRYAAVAGVVTPAGGQLLVFGGEHDGVPIDAVQDVDLTSGRTRIVGHLPVPLAHEAAFTLGDQVWLAGGRSHDQLQSRIWRWDLPRRRAVAAGRLPYPVADAGLAVDDPRTAYLLGGETPDPTSRVVVLTLG